MEDKFYLQAMLLKPGRKFFSVNLPENLFPFQIGHFILSRKIIACHDGFVTFGIQFPYQTAGYKAGCPCYHDHNENLERQY
jgi:hypothetical protein